ncbi:MAG: hypothetical protein HQL72_12175 [Magnetococcales bacterium]|nr:hypothetical protein [Magnetococcales bacterium]
MSYRTLSRHADNPTRVGNWEPLPVDPVDDVSDYVPVHVTVTVEIAPRPFVEPPPKESAFWSFVLGAALGFSLGNDSE